MHHLAGLAIDVSALVMEDGERLDVRHRRRGDLPRDSHPQPRRSHGDHFHMEVLRHAERAIVR
jgi:hypothetical protein